MAKRKPTKRDPADLLRHVPREPQWHSTSVIARAARLSHMATYHALAELFAQARIRKHRVGMRATWSRSVA